MSEEQQEPRSLKEYIAHLRGPGAKTVSDDLRSADEIERLTTEGATKDDLLRQWLHVEVLSDQELHTLRCETIEAVLGGHSDTD